MIDEELRHVEELGSEFLDVVGVIAEGLPGGRDAVELPVHQVEAGGGSVVVLLVVVVVVCGGVVVA